MHKLWKGIAPKIICVIDLENIFCYLLKLGRYEFLIIYLLLLPRDPQGVLACCNPVPTLVKQHVNEIHQLIMQAKELALTTNKVLIVGFH